MNAEQFGLILQMVGAAGDGAFGLAVVYMVVSFFKALTIPAAFIGLGIVVTRCVRHCVSTDSQKYAAAAATRRTAELEWHRNHYPDLNEQEVRAGRMP